MSDGERNLTAEVAAAQPAESAVPVGLKRFVQGAGLILLIFGLPFTVNLFCIVPLVLLNNSGSEITTYGVVSLTLALITAGAGLAAFVHANNSLHNRPSKPMHLPSPPLLLLGVFVLLIAFGLALNPDGTESGIFLTPTLVLCALLPPLWAVAWMIPSVRARRARVKEQAADLSAVENAQVSADQPSLSWRRGLMAFAGGATVSVFIAIVLEILLPVIVLSLVFNLADTLSDQINALFRSLSNAEVAEALTNPGFIFLFVQLAVIAPLAEELAKPLVTLPLLRHLDNQEAFWLGALAGAGFAALENVIYATSGLSIWAGILVVRALGGALHPLGSGLVAQGWWGVVRGEKDAGVNWLKRFALAVAMHAAWNGGSLLVITLGGARFFGELPPEIGLLGLSAAGTTLAFLLVLGIAALWIGRLYGHNKPVLVSDEEPSPESGFVPSDRALALWAVVCLIALVPAGIAGLKLWLR
jgi:RsiW-degrading membrane proteinase PrsW (M82 family)